MKHSTSRIDTLEQFLSREKYDDRDEREDEGKCAKLERKRELKIDRKRPRVRLAFLCFRGANSGQFLRNTGAFFSGDVGKISQFAGRNTLRFHAIS